MWLGLMRLRGAELARGGGEEDGVVEDWGMRKKKKTKK